MSHPTRHECWLGSLRPTPCALLLAAAAVGTQGSAAAQALGTLFYSPAERSAIVRERNGADADGAAVRLSVSGVVKRARGKSTVWINRLALPEGQLAPGSRETTISATGVTVDGEHLRVGETLDTRTRERTDIVAPDALHAKGRR